MKLRSGEKVLFIGDSITECMRETVEPPLGAGYVQFAHCLLAARHPTLEVEFVNRGVAGETILDMDQRWDRDAIEQRPDWLFTMIGVNDVLYRLVGDQTERAVDDDAYRAAYVRILEKTQAALDCRIVLLEPSPLEEHLPAPSHAVMRKLVQVVRDVGAQFGVDVVDIYERFYRTVEASPQKGWLIDVPHPNLKGQMILTLAVLDYLEW